VAQDEAALNYQDPAMLQRSIDTQKSVILEHANRMGLPPEYVQMKTKEVESQTHSTVINRMLSNGQDKLASQYFAANREVFTGKDIIQVEKALEEGSLRGESQRLSDEIMGKTKTMTAALEEAREIKDPKLRDAVTERVRGEFSLKKAAEAEDQEKRFQSYADIIEKNGGRPDQSGGLLPPAQWMALDLKERQALETRAKQLREGIPPSTDWAKYYELKTLATNSSTREEFLRENLMVYRPNMADAEFKELVNLQQQLRSGDEKALDGYRTKAQIVASTLSAAGLDPTPAAGKKEAQQVAEFQRQVDAEVMALQKRTGKEATNEEVQDIVDNLIVKGHVPGTGFLGFFRDEKFAFEAKEGDVLVVDIDDIPRKDRLEIEAYLKKSNYPVTEDSVRAMYQAMRFGSK
jgi:hypothetical protein